MFIDYIKIAWQSLTKRRLRSWLTLLGILVGIATVVSLIGLGEGLREAIVGQFNLVGNDVITIQASGTGQGPPGSGVVRPLRDRDVDAIDRVQGVSAVVGRTVNTALIQFRDETKSGFIQTVPNNNPEELYAMLRIDIDQGRLLRAGEGNRIVVGADFADGEFNRPVEIGNRITIREQEFRVVGILERKGSFITDGSIYMNHDVARQLFNRNDELDLVLAQVVDENELSIVRERIERTLRNQRNVRAGEEDFSVQTAATSAQSINNILGGVNVFIIALAMISIIVGAIGITNTMFTSVLERTAQIGTMKAVGAQNKDIFFLFFVESGLLGAVGGLIGIIVGVAFAHLGAFGANQAFGTQLFTVQISFTLLALSLAGSFFVGAIAGVIPALRAANMQPVKALMYGK